MPQVDTPGMQLRIFCICGQKMKVSSTMFGRPGKCIACRQKIRIPRLDEIPQDVTEIYLKDFPEFLRKPQPPQQFSEVDRLKAEADAPDTGDDVEDVALGEDAPDGPVIPMDPLEPLRVLCSLEEKVGREIERAKRPSKDGPPRADRETLVRYRALIRNARSAFDDRLRDRLLEANEQLNAVRESLARAAMSLRVGEMPHDEYQDKVRPLRIQRDRWERRLQNLRGWLATSDAALAGGYLDLRLEDVPVEPEDVVFASDARPTAVLLDQHVEALRSAMRERASAERKLAEWQRMERERALAPLEIEMGRRESEAIRLRAAAEVAFIRGRLEQAAQDTEQDNKGIRSYLETLRARLQSGDLDANAYKSTESALTQAQNNNTNARELARRALAANSPADIPRPSSTLMQRLAVVAHKGDGGVGADSLLAWGAAAAMICTLLLPIARTQPAGNLVSAPGLSYGLFVCALVLSLIALVPNRALRAALLNVAWVIACVAGAGYLHEAWHGTSTLGAAMRSDPAWFSSPGLLLLAMCAMLTGLAAAVSVLSVQQLRRAPAVAAGVILIVLAMILTDGLGMLSPEPVLTEPTSTIATDRDGEYEVKMELGNNGWRALPLGGDTRTVATPSTFLLEHRVGNDSWDDVTLRSLSRASLAGQLDGRANNFPTALLQGGERVSVTYYLPPGTYRARILAPGGVDRTPMRTFTLVDLPETATSEAQETIAPPKPRSTDAAQPPATPSASREEMSDETDTPQNTPPTPIGTSMGAIVALQGVINAEGRDPRFILRIDAPGEDTRRDYTALGDIIFGKWKAAEFNPETQTLTVSDGTRLIVLERGVEMTLDAPSGESTPPVGRTPVPGEIGITESDAGAAQQ